MRLPGPPANLFAQDIIGNLGRATTKQRIESVELGQGSEERHDLRLYVAFGPLGSSVSCLPNERRWHEARPGATHRR